jgi:hypothetical protein
VIQECARPVSQSSRSLWFGDNPSQGIAVIANGLYRIRALPAAGGLSKYVIPVEVFGPINFLIIAVWAQRNAAGRYVEGVVRAVDLYRHLFARYPTVLIGDLNSNAIWDSSHPVDFSHSSLVKLLSELGLVSSYHYFHQESHGAEKQPTHYFRWNEERPFHIDYCFTPKDWATSLQAIEVGSFEEWKAHSDHRPIIVDLAPPYR